ncbi:39S ribosomal protein L46, mitochondrial [Conger conger]|uniref:39S ribosomal protein L46, mitochondrial n=1 Tax=Conger conger TaxID=82655 RepID=UPI002A5A8BC2|nr:39S ribosomal protein L46, mitochondrial [Conger conger]
MAAPTCKMAARPLRGFLTCISGTYLRNNVNRRLSLTIPCSSVLIAKKPEINAVSPWTLHGAVCLQRLPILSQDRSPIEEQFDELMNQMELERSLLSEHELRLLEDAERMSRKQAEDYDSDDEYFLDQDVITAQDMEDSWEQRLQKFQPAPRHKDEVDMDMSSVDRCLGDSLVLLAKQQVGGEELWLLPQLQWQAGETLRQTAERSLASLPGDYKGRFLGNTPCGVYKYKFPKAIRTELSVGAKVFFFKALLSSRGSSPPESGAFVWVRKGELHNYLKPQYLKQVNGCIIDI